MRKFEIWLMSTSTILVGGTGIALYVIKNWITSADPFAVVHHPAQPWVLRIHLIGVPFLIFAAGLIFSDHVAGRLRRGGAAGRRSGVGLLAMFAPMALSGVLIQLLTVESWVRAAVWIHLVSGTVYLGGFLVHRLRHRREAATRNARINPRKTLSTVATTYSERTD